MEQIVRREGGERPFAVHVFGHTTVRTPDRTLRARRTSAPGRPSTQGARVVG